MNAETPLEVSLGTSQDGSQLERVAPGVLRIRANNPGPMTLDGTNTWVLHEPESDSAVVVDPGPALAAHAATIRAVLAEHGLGVEAVLLTHAHVDHSELAHEFAAAVRAPLRAAEPEWSTGAPLIDQERIPAAGLDMQVLSTPGHSSDSVSFATGRYLLTGDTVLGYGTTVVAHPDGRLADYLQSLGRLQGWVAVNDVAALLPGHGPVIEDPAGRLEFYVSHRRERLAAVEAVVSELAPNVGELADAALDAVVDATVARVYSDVPRHLWPAAALSVRAQVRYLAEDSAANP